MPVNILNKKRKGQLKSLETVAAVIFFSLLLILGIIFFSRFQAEQGSQQKEESISLSATSLAQIITEMPEIRCEMDNCIDIYRFVATAQMARANGKLFYSSAFGTYANSVLYANITLRKIYPETGSILLYNRAKASNSGSQLFEFPVSAYNATSGKYIFSMLSIRVYR